MKYFERKVSGQTLYNGIVVSVHLDNVELYNGMTARREVVEHPGGVCIVPVDENGNVTVVRQFRYPFGEEMLEVPAGKLEYGENPYSCAMRELSEETGLEPEKLVSLGEIYPSPGFCSERLYIYLAENCSQGDAHPDEGEFLDVMKVSISEMTDKIMSGEIKDAKTIVAILKAEKYLSRSDDRK